jgi:hypothetical protein
MKRQRKSFFFSLRRDILAEAISFGPILALSTPLYNALFPRSGAIFPFQNGPVPFGRQGRFGVLAKIVTLQ